jgi:hypothetical protein
MESSWTTAEPLVDLKQTGWAAWLTTRNGRACNARNRRILQRDLLVCLDWSGLILIWIFDWYVAAELVWVWLSWNGRAVTVQKRKAAAKVFDRNSLRSSGWRGRTALVVLGFWYRIEFHSKLENIKRRVILKKNSSSSWVLSKLMWLFTIIIKYCITNHY